jgi:hypothetical protein
MRNFKQRALNRLYNELKHLTLFFMHNTVQENGKTVKENNLDNLHHKIPVGTLVEVKYDNWFGEGACEKVHARLWVIKHTRDCDGTPLYSLSRYKDWKEGQQKNSVHGFGGESLKVIEITDDVKEGVGAIEWDDDELWDVVLNNNYSSNGGE